MQFPQWSEAYGHWHTKDYRSWREHHIKAIPPKLIGVQLGLLAEEDVEKLRGFFEKAAPKIQGLLKKPGQRTSQEMDIISDVSFIGMALAHLDHWRKEGGPASEGQAATDPTEANLEPVPVNGSAGLVLYDKMRIAIRQCEQIDEIAKIRDQAEQLNAYNQIRKDTETANLFKEIRDRAKTRIGELSQDLAKSQGSRTDRLPPDDRKKSKEQTLAEAGISTSTAHDYENLAGPPDQREASRAAQEEYFAQQRANNESITQQGLQDAVDKAVGKKRKAKAAPLPSALKCWIALGAEYGHTAATPPKAPELFTLLISNEAFRKNWLPVAKEFQIYAIALMNALLDYQALGEEAWREKYENVSRGNSQQSENGLSPVAQPALHLD